MNASDIAAHAQKIVAGDRQNQYGDKLKNHDNIARLWQAYLEIRRDPTAPLNAEDVVLMMDLLKTARTQLGATTMDTYIDKAGYSACAGEIAARMEAGDGD